MVDRARDSFATKNRKSCENPGAAKKAPAAPEGAAGGSGTGEEKRIAQVLSAISGAGKVEVAVYYSGAEGLAASGAPVGAVVVAEGADSMEVRLNLIRAVRTLLGLPEAAVDVFSMEAGR